MKLFLLIILLLPATVTHILMRISEKTAHTLSVMNDAYVDLAERTKKERTASKDKE